MHRAARGILAVVCVLLAAILLHMLYDAGFVRVPERPGIPLRPVDGRVVVVSTMRDCEDRVAPSLHVARGICGCFRGGGHIESVLIPMTSRSGDVDADASASDDGNGDGDGDNEGENEGETTASDQKLTRVTLCISTQHGCAMGCRFCANG